MAAHQVQELWMLAHLSVTLIAPGADLQAMLNPEGHNLLLVMLLRSAVGPIGTDHVTETKVSVNQSSIVRT